MAQPSQYNAISYTRLLPSTQRTYDCRSAETYFFLFPATKHREREKSAHFEHWIRLFGIRNPITGNCYYYILYIVCRVAFMHCLMSPVHTTHTHTHHSLKCASSSAYATRVSSLFSAAYATSLCSWWRLCIRVRRRCVLGLNLPIPLFFIRRNCNAFFWAKQNKNCLK